MKKCKICGTKTPYPLCQNCIKNCHDVGPTKVSFAYERTLPQLSLLLDVTVLDIYSNPIGVVSMNGYDKLKQLRISKCPNLTKIEIVNAPNLKSCDFISNKNLKSAVIENVASLVSIDLSFCENCNLLQGIFPRAQYISVSHTKINVLPDAPNIKYLDISSSLIRDLTYLPLYHQLQILIAMHLKINELDIGPLTALPNFSSIQTDIKHISVTTFNNEHSLKSIWLKGCETCEAFPIETNVSFCSPDGSLDGYSFQKPVLSGDWHDAQRLLYGPWPPPPSDLKLMENIRVVSHSDTKETRRESFAPTCEIPKLPSRILHPPCDITKCCDSIAGCLMGLGIADSLTICTERLPSKEYINFVYETAPDPTWSHARINRRSADVPRGSFTDFTAHTLTFVQSVMATGGHAVAGHLAKRLKETIRVGFGGRPTSSASVSPSVSQIVAMDEFIDDPVQCARTYWERAGRTASGNGCVCRTAGVGCIGFWDVRTVLENARVFCSITHFDPRCVFAASLVSLLIADILRWRCGILTRFDVDETVAACFAAFPDLSAAHLRDLRRYTGCRSFDEIDATSYLQMALQAMGFAVAALRMRLPFEEAIDRVLRAGGDAHANAAVVGAVLGALYGERALPRDLSAFFWARSSIAITISDMMAFMGVETRPLDFYLV